MAKRSDHGNETLPSFAEILNKCNYDLVYTLCITAKEQLERLQERETPHVASQYVALCNQLAGEIQQYISIKREHLVPYVNSLFEKDADGHDCRNCTGTGSCSLQHDIRLIEIRRSHQQLKDIIHRLQLAAYLYSGATHPDSYKILHDQMALLERSLAALLLHEETLLIPKIAEAQKNINARS